MSDYQLATSDPVGPVIRTTDQAHIPADPANRDWVEYQNWLALGNTPDLYVPPDPVPVPPAPEVADAVLLDHENRNLHSTPKHLPPCPQSEHLGSRRNRLVSFLAACPRLA